MKKKTLTILLIIACVLMLVAGILFVNYFTNLIFRTLKEFAIPSFFNSLSFTYILLIISILISIFVIILTIFVINKNEVEVSKDIIKDKINKYKVFKTQKRKEKLEKELNKINNHKDIT